MSRWRLQGALVSEKCLRCQDSAHSCLSGTMLNCGLHTCPQNCHRLDDHSNVKCTYTLHDKCPKGHQRFWKCHESVRGCTKCDAETRRKEKELQKALKAQEKRAREEQEHSEHMAKLDDLIEEERRRLREAQLARERALAFQQKEKDLADAQNMRISPSSSLFNAQAKITKEPTPDSSSDLGRNQPTLSQNPNKKSSNPAGTAQTSSSEKSNTQPSAIRNLPPPDWTKRRNSPAKKDWEHQKRTLNSRNGDIDSLMDLIGLEEVKLQILQIKAKIEVSIRQNADISKDRLNISFLGNPGTGELSQSNGFMYSLSMA